MVPYHNRIVHFICFGLSSPFSLTFNTERAKNIYQSVGYDIIDIESVRELLKTEPNTAFFWSGTTDGIGGQDRALEIAKKHDGVTLAFVIETNKIDMPDWDFNNPKWVEAWEQVSAAYAEQASGEIHAVIGTKLREGSMWETTEVPRLKANPDVTKITIIDPKTEEEKIIFER